MEAPGRSGGPAGGRVARGEAPTPERRHGTDAQAPGYQEAPADSDERALRPGGRAVRRRPSREGEGA